MKQPTLAPQLQAQQTQRQELTLLLQALLDGGEDGGLAAQRRDVLGQPAEAAPMVRAARFGVLALARLVPGASECIPKGFPRHPGPAHPLSLAQGRRCSGSGTTTATSCARRLSP